MIKILSGCLLLMSMTLQASVSPRIVGGTLSRENAWPFMTALMQKAAELNIANESYTAFFLAGVPQRSFSGALVNCEQGFDVCSNAKGKICLIERGITFFSEKIANCRIGGGIAAVIYNNEVSSLSWRADNAKIPAVSISQNDGQILLNHLGEQIQYVPLDTIPTTSFCGGSYIGGKWVVTAAHCVSNVSADLIALNIGGQNLETDQDNIYYAKRIALHQRWNPETIENDVALIELTTEPQGITPIKIADESQLTQAIEDFTEVTAIGRGSKLATSSKLVTELERPDPLLYEVNLSVVSNRNCEKIFDEYEISNGADPTIVDTTTNIASGMLCAGNLAGGEGTCFGDSGGPLVLNQNGENYLIGLTSWGVGCAQPDLYGVYSRAPHYKDSIEAVLNDQYLTRPTDFPSLRPRKSGGSLNILTMIFFVSLGIPLIYRQSCQTKSRRQSQSSLTDSNP
ncbi:MAG TPA: trypsin-like serine protease [Gammaproteobacteria bacterium]|nr:trypsin-like serine protease [Gammaproteobacteria bacterium]